MIALVWISLALDLVIIFVATGGAGLSWRAGPLQIRVHDPSNPLLIAVALSGLLVALSWRTPRRRTWALAAVAVIVAITGIAVTRHAERLFPLADIAVIELYARDALAGKLLVGPYSRFGWHHPGPSYFYLIAPSYALAGQQPAALAAGAAAIMTAAVALIAWTAARSYGSMVTAALLASIAAYLVRLPDLATSPWNPHVIVMPMIAMIVVSAVVACGDLALLPISVFLASFVVQTHLALAPLAASVVTVSAIAGLSDARRRAQYTRSVRPVRLTVWVMIALWFLPAAEQAAHTPGNVTLLWRFFVSNPSMGQPLAAAARAWAAILDAPLGSTIQLAGGSSFEAVPLVRSLVVGLLQLLAVGIAAVWSARKGYRQLAWLAVLGLVASIVGLWSVTRIQGRIMDHEIFWLTGVCVLNLSVVAGTAGLWVRRHGDPFEVGPRVTPVVCGSLLAVCVFVSLSQLARARAGHLPMTLSSPVAELFGKSLRDYVHETGVQRPLFRIGEEAWGSAAGALLELDRAGVPFAVEYSWLPMFPQSFAATGDEDAEITISNEDRHRLLAERPGNVLIAGSDGVYFDAVRVERGPR
jgi:hypothetical protein